MKILVGYNFFDPIANIHENGTITIPVCDHAIFNDETISSIQRYIEGLVGIKYGYFVIGCVVIEKIEIKFNSNT